MPWGLKPIITHLKDFLDGKIYIFFVPWVVKTIIVPLKYFFDGKYT